MTVVSCGWLCPSPTKKHLSSRRSRTTCRRWRRTSRPASMLPRRGTAYAVLLLCHAARLAERRDVADWVRAARAHGAFVAAATDLVTPAEQLLGSGLAENGGSITLAPPLAGISGIANRTALFHVARVL